MLQTRLLRGESSLEGLDLPVLQAHAFALSGEGPPAYDDAIFAAVKVPAQGGRAEENEHSNTEWEKP